MLNQAFGLPVLLEGCQHRVNVVVPGPKLGSYAVVVNHAQCCTQGEVSFACTPWAGQVEVLTQL